MTSSAEELRRALPILVLLTLLGPLSRPVRSCGPFFPPTLLGEDGVLLEIPAHPFVAEVKRLESLPAARYSAVESFFPARSTASAGREQLLAALGLDERTARRDARVVAYDELRTALGAHREALEDWRYALDWRGSRGEPPPRPVLPPVTLPEGLPGELDLYLRGAVAYHRGETDAARHAWTELLALPPAERRLRSVWVEFMLGRVELAEAEARGAAGGDAAPGETALTHFRRTRELTSGGFPDPLGLAQDSLGWEARIEWSRDRWARAFELYGEQLASGDDRAGESLHEVCRRALGAGDDALEAIATSPFAREVMTLYLAGHWHDTASGVEVAAAWADRLSGHGVDTVATAGTIAWVAYQTARFDDAERWAGLAAESDSRARWVRAKLMLRQGRLVEAAELLDALGGEAGEIYAARAEGEAGAIDVARGLYSEALDRLLRNGYWIDAAYVAERLMTFDELIAYVGAAWPRELPDQSAYWPSGDGTERPPDEWIAWRIRHLLARRLARDGRWAEAAPYYPGDRLPAVSRQMAGWLECADDPSCPREKRAAALWEAAKALRGHGLALTGSALTPDFHAWSGRFQYGPQAPWRADFEVLPASPQEVERWQRSAIEPDRRYHYRFRATDLAWRAAELMPDQEPDTAWVLAVGGSWIKNLDPRAADRFYKALVRRCGRTALGREADRRRWFPPLSG